MGAAGPARPLHITSASGPAALASQVDAWQPAGPLGPGEPYGQRELEVPHPRQLPFMDMHMADVSNWGDGSGTISGTVWAAVATVFIYGDDLPPAAGCGPAARSLLVGWEWLGVAREGDFIARPAAWQAGRAVLPLRLAPAWTGGLVTPLFKPFTGLDVAACLPAYPLHEFRSASIRMRITHIQPLHNRQ